MYPISQYYATLSHSLEVSGAAETLVFFYFYFADAQLLGSSCFYSYKGEGIPLRPLSQRIHQEEGSDQAQGDVPGRTSEEEAKEANKEAETKTAESCPRGHHQPSAMILKAFICVLCVCLCFIFYE